MNLKLKIFLPVFLLMFAEALPAQTNTNLLYWTLDLNFSLTAWTNAPVRTNGMIGRTQARFSRIFSRDLIQALSGRPVLPLGKTLVSFQIVVTNVVPGPDILTTNDVTEAVPVYLEPTNVAFSDKARLVWMQPVGYNRDWEPFVVVQDGGVDYAINNYLQARMVSFDGRSEPSVLSGRKDLVHDLVAYSSTSVRQFVFDPNALSAWPPTGAYFDVQGWSSTQESGLTAGTNVLANRVIRSSVISPAGTGKWGNPPNFATIRGTVTLSGGRRETR
jgi:hypothetical protein